MSPTTRSAIGDAAGKGSKATVKKNSAPSVAHGHLALSDEGLCHVLEKNVLLVFDQLVKEGHVSQGRSIMPSRNGKVSPKFLKALHGMDPHCVSTLHLKPLNLEQRKAILRLCMDRASSKRGKASVEDAKWAFSVARGCEAEDGQRPLQSRRSTEKAASKELSSVRPTFRMLTRPLRSSSRAAMVSTTSSRRATRSSASARSSQVIEIEDETQAHDMGATAEQKLPPSPKVAHAPTESPLADVKPSMPTLIGESGSYQIFRLCATLSKKEKAAHAKPIMLGLKFEPKDRMGKRLQTSFKKGHKNYTTVNAVKRGSIAERAGVFKDDILVWWSHKEPVVYHQLLGCAADKCDVVWEFINEDTFEAKQPSKMLKACGAFKFYVARPTADESVSESDEPTPATRLSAPAVNIGPEIVVRAKRFNSLTDREKDNLLQDAKDDAQKSFEKDRGAIVKSLPKAVTDAFFQIGFAAWGQKKPITYTPVLVLSPFIIPPGPVRLEWLEKYQKKSKKLDTMHHLVYFYGETDPNNQFALLSQLKFLSLADGKEKDCHLLPASIQKKLRRKQKLTAAEEAKVRAQDEMERDVPKKPEERLSGKIPSFAEFHSSLTEFDLTELANGNGTGFSAGGKRASDKNRRSSDERHLKRRAASDADSSTGAVASSLTAGVPDTSIIGHAPCPSKLSKYPTARKIAPSEHLQPPGKRQRLSQTVYATKANGGSSFVEDPASLRNCTKGSQPKTQTMDVIADACDLPSIRESTATARPPPENGATVSPSRDGSEVPAAPSPPAQGNGDLTPPAPSGKTPDIATTAADEDALSATLPVARGNGKLLPPAPAEDTIAPTKAEIQGFEGRAEESKLSATSTKHAQLGQMIVETNKTLWAEYIELQDELKTLKGSHQMEIAAFKKLCKSHDAEGNGEGEEDDDDDAKAKAAVSTVGIAALEELRPPIDSGTGSDWYYEYSQFVRKADLQNADLAKASGQLKENISDLKERRAKLHALQQEHAKLQALQQELAKKVVELAN